MASVFTMPFVPALGTSGQFLPGAKLFFYEPATTTPKSVYSDAAQTTAHANPVVADASGRFANIFLADGEAYRVILTTSAGVELGDIDNYISDGGLLRSDLADDTGAELIGTATGQTLAQRLANSAIRPVRGTRAFVVDRIRAVAEAIELSDPATSPIWGFAKYGGITGGFGKTETILYDPDGDGVDASISVPFVRFVINDSDDVDTPGSLRWACAEVEANDGGYIIVHPRGPQSTRLTAPLFLPNNCTFAAPGRNYTIKQGLSTSGLRFYGPGASAEYGRNVIVWGVNVIVEGGGNIAEYDQAPGEVDAIAAVPSFGSNKVCLYECTVSGATDGFFDIAGGSSIAAACYFSILKCVVRNTDKVLAVSAGTGGTNGDTPYVFVTVGRCHFDGCSQRKPLVSSQAYVHFHGNVDDAVPHYRDYTEGTSIGSFGAGSARNGGQLRFEGNICRIGTTSAGLAGAVHAGVENTTGAEGAATLIDNYFEAGITGTSSFNSANVIALPSGYEYPVLDVLTDTDAAAQTIIEAAGAGRTNWPSGLYAPVDSTTADAEGISAYANGEQIVHDNGTFWVRVDEEIELPNKETLDPLNVERGTTLTIASGAITLLDDRYIAIDGEGLVADELDTINLTTDTDYAPITGGLIFIRAASASAAITVKDSTGNINLAADVVLDNTAKVLALIYDGAAWHQASGW